MIRLPIPPSVNAMYRNVPGKGRVKTGAYKTWASAAGYSLLRQRPEKHKGDVILNLQFGPRNKRADVSNLIKATEDLLVNMGVIEDDRFVVSVLAAWNDSVDGALVEVRAA